MRKIALVFIILLIAATTLIVFKPRQERITPSEAAGFRADRAAYLEMVGRNMVSGGPPKDGIPAIDEPTYISAGEAGLQPADRVFGIVIDGRAKAFPQDILYWHEVVNEDNYSITYCPLTGSVIGYRGRNLGVSGKLYNSNLVLYDRATGSEIPQMLGIAVNGPLRGEALPRFPVVVTTWRQWLAAHPGTLVLSRDTGYARDYDRNPYPGYDALLGIWFPVAAESDSFPSKRIVTGFELNDDFLAVPKGALDRPASVVLGGENVTIAYDETTGALSATAEDGEEALSVDAYWFAWYAYHPGTRVLELG